MKGAGPVALAVFAASFLGALALRAGDLGHTPWYISRASGLVAFALLTGSVVLGLLVSTKAADRWLPRPLTFEIHAFISLLTLTFLGIHAGSLMFDGFLHFAPGDLLVAFASSYRPFLTGLGVISAWATALVAASFWARKRIGQRNWRRFHYVSFAAYLLGLVHGFGAGSDAALPAVYWMYVLSAATVAALLAYRISGRLLEPAPSRARAAARRPVSR